MEGVGEVVMVEVEVVEEVAPVAVDAAAPWSLSMVPSPLLALEPLLPFCMALLYLQGNRGEVRGSQIILKEFWNKNWFQNPTTRPRNQKTG